MWGWWRYIHERLLRYWRAWAGPRTLGQRGEYAARRYLQARGYRILHVNYEILGGELDIVALDGRTIVFVEVKTRKDESAEAALSAVDVEKQRQLSRVALAYLRRYHLLTERARFDVCGVIWPEQGGQPIIQHIRHAFEASF
ncbi:MAG: YraN family protein [Pirellulales bacterium]|nr:YraN family protein [Pirellulales bacterium]